MSIKTVVEEIKAVVLEKNHSESPEKTVPLESFVSLGQSRLCSATEK